MKYSVQNKFGEVFGIYDAPLTVPALTVDEFTEQLKVGLADNPLIVDIEAAPLTIQDEDGKFQAVDRVVININPDTEVGLHSLDDVHTAVGMVSLMHELGGES